MCVLSNKYVNKRHVLSSSNTKRVLSRVKGVGLSVRDLKPTRVPGSSLVSAKTCRSKFDVCQGVKVLSPDIRGAAYTW